MKAVQTVVGPAAPLGRADIDTDTIIPQNWLITTERDGLGIGLFSNWRYLDGNFSPNPNFVLNEPRFEGARIIVAGPNYGCGSSREHAVWAHLDFGIQAIIAPSFGPIFFDNALKNGLLAIVLGVQETTGLIAQLQAGPNNQMRVDLDRQEVSGPDSLIYKFAMDDKRRQAILQGDDDIAATLRMSSAIDEFQNADRLSKPWLWPASAAV
jgi:3-isopropylmalate/(R)-2-methylmalate dehydratase small subunit